MFKQTFVKERNKMQDLYGCFLLISFGSICYLLSIFIDSQIQAKKIYGFNGWTKGVILVLTVISLWKFDNAYRHHFSKEAIAYKEMCKIMDNWEAGKIGKKTVIERLNYLEGNSKPWGFADNDSTDNSEKDPLFGY